MKAILSEKGQITIPKPLREVLGLGPGQVIEFEAKNGALIGKKKGIFHPLDEVVGYLKAKNINIDDYLDQTRGARPNKSKK